MHCFPGRNQKQAGAIRPLDVAAIVCVVSVLAFLAVFGAGHFKERALRTRCRANLLQIGTALQLYAKDNHDLLPDCSRANPRFAGPQWPWDMHTNLANVLETKGAARQNFYCPANPAVNDDRHWNFWKSDPGPVRVIGYGLLLKGIRQVPSSFWRTSLSATNQIPPAQAELAFDATACVDDDYLNIHGTWVDRSNHVRGKRPLGGNILFEDQHVDWRDFSEMQIRFNTIGPGGTVQWSF
jgi:hypothetical protein